MDNLELKVLERNETKKGAARKLRAQGLVPGIVYGNKSEPTLVSFLAKDIESVVAHGGLHSIINLNFENAAKKKKSTVVIKQVQRSPLKGRIEHVDMQNISLTQEIETALPVVIIGEEECPGLRVGGVVQHGSRELSVKGIAKDLPDHIDVDISSLELGTQLKAQDVVLPDGVELVGNPEDVVLSIVQPAKREEEIPVLEAEQPGEVTTEKAEEKVASSKESGG